MMTPGCPPHFPSRPARLARACATLRLVVVALGTVTLMGVAGCGGDPESPPPSGGGSSGGNNGSGGSSAGAGGNRGGSGGSGATPDGGGAGGGSGGNTEAASVRFCNGVAGTAGPVVVEVQIGNSKAQAETSTCASPCLSVPAGTSRVSFRMGGAEVFAQDITFEAGQHYGVIASLDNATKKVGLGGGKLPAGQQCGGYNPFGDGTGGKPLGKFCHSLRVASAMGQTGMPVELELAVGDVRFKATSGGCSSPAAQACVALPTGPVTATLTHDGQTIATSMLTFDPTKAYFLSANVDGAGMPVITSQAVASPMACAALGGMTTTMPPPDAKSTLKFCNRMPVTAGVAGVAEIVTQDGVRFMARPGQCAPAKGTACSKVAAGTNMVTLSIDGTEVGSAGGTFPADREVVLRLALTAAGEPQFTLQTVPTGMMCADYEPM